ncbi:hypothetical protein IUK39_29190 [Priestia aryabhattai]|uniref:hypothetical protein n=1 Tax=Priestia aryabhattai TaxID=412384 RepID=UPI001C0D282A|nr:hypothetical protein [Priestia aryabhattai]MBU3574118.1 hypothetical protein [Priestia aryabhattai]
MKFLSVVLVIALTILFFFSPAITTLASTTYKWRTSVDVPVAYSPKIKYMEKSILLQGPRPTKTAIRLQLIKKGILSEKVYDEIIINPSNESNTTFKTILHAPSGQNYYIKIGALMSSGILIITPH